MEKINDEVPKKKVDVWKYKEYKCKVKVLEISTGKKILILNETEAKEHDIYLGYRTTLKYDGKKLTAIVDVSQEAVKWGEVGIFKEIAKELGLKGGETIEIIHMDRPESIQYIKDKLDGKVLSDNAIKTIISDLMENKLGSVELSAWVSGVYVNGLSDQEIVSLTDSIVNSGDKLNLGVKTICDKHCVPAETPTIVRNSNNVKVESMGKIIDNIFDRCKPEQIQFDGVAEHTDKNLNNLKVLSYDEYGNVKFVPVSAVYRLKSPKYLYNFSLIGNRNVSATKDHTIFVLKKGKIANISIQNINPGDYVLVPIGFESNTINSIQIKNNFGDKTIPDSIEITPEFMRLLGYYISEGFTNYQGVFFNFGSHEKELIKDTIKCIKKIFGVNPTINKPHKTATRVCIYRQTLSKLFNELLKFNTGALNKRIPYFIFDVDKDMKLEFLRALFKGDGYVRRGYEAIYVTASKKLAIDLQYLLSMMGISVSLSRKKPGKRKFPLGNGKYYTSNTSESFYIYTQARALFGGREKANVAYINLLPIAELGQINKKTIGWVFRKHLKEQKYMTKQKLARIIEHIESNDVKKLIKSNLSVLEVKEVKKISSTSEYVYDFKVDGYNKFIAGSAPICIHNSIGGVAGNRTTLLVVPIIAAAGLHIPKSSSRAITSAAGTADVMEVLSPVDLNISEMKKIVLKAKGAIVWGGGLNLASADDKLIKVRNPLRLDPEGMLISSILAKKKAVGASHVIIDIPIGRGAKIEDLTKAKSMGHHFIDIGEKGLGMDIEALVTDGSEPIGSGVGVSLEARDVLRILEAPQLMGRAYGKVFSSMHGPEDLKHKSCLLAGKLLELSKKVKPGDGYGIADELIRNGKALAKLKEIIELQGGDPKLTSKDLPIGKYVHDVHSERTGKIHHIDSKTISKIARIAGAPHDHGSGIYLYKSKGDSIKKGDKLFTIYSESNSKLKYAVKALKDLEPIEMRKFILGILD